MSVLKKISVLMFPWKYTDAVYGGGMKRPVPTLAEMRKLWRAVAAWVDKNEVSCVETIYQTDRVQEALPELAEEAAKIVGFKPLDPV